MPMQNLEKTGIVLVPYGSSSPQAMATYEHILAAYEREFPCMPIGLAFTSELMIKRLKAKEGISVVSPRDAFTQLYDQGCDRAVVQSLQIVPGGEFHRLILQSRVSPSRDYERQESNPESKSLKVEIGLPLLSSLEDCRKVSGILPDLWGGKAREDEEKEGGQTDRPVDSLDLDSKKEAVILAGHGTGHPADAVYSQMARVLKKDYGSVLLGTIEGFPGLPEMQEELKDLRAKKVKLRPFLLVAGEHAKNDIAGPGPQSWRSTLEREGFEVDVRLAALGEMQGIVWIFQEHTRRALEKMDSS